MQDFIALANRLADIAGEIVRTHYRTPFEIVSKDDDSPVTLADRGIETALRDVLDAERPDDGIIGEEFGEKPSKSGYTWVIDPIDGTKSFVIGRPTFGTLIALCKGDVPVLGVIDQAILGERWVGVTGTQTTFNGVPVSTRACASFDLACASSTTPAMFKDERVYKDIEANTKMMTWGADCYAYGLLASGFIDIVIEDSLSVYDFAALVPVVEGAGGTICDWCGAPLTLKSGGDVVAMGDARLWCGIKKY